MKYFFPGGAQIFENGELVEHNCFYYRTSRRNSATPIPAFLLYFEKELSDYIAPEYG
jgi:hypothetical protein